MNPKRTCEMCGKRTRRWREIALAGYDFKEVWCIDCTSKDVVVPRPRKYKHAVNTEPIGPLFSPEERELLKTESAARLAIQETYERWCQFVNVVPRKLWQYDDWWLETRPAARRFADHLRSSAVGVSLDDGAIVEAGATLGSVPGFTAPKALTPPTEPDAANNTRGVA